MSLKHHYLDERSWTFTEKNLTQKVRWCVECLKGPCGLWKHAEGESQFCSGHKSHERSKGTCITCNGKKWVYCRGNVELGCQDSQLEHIHTCPDCN